VLVWANVHGSFFLAPLVLGLAWLEDLHDRVEHPHRVLAVAFVSVLTACVTPFGPAVWIYAAGLSTNSQVTNEIAEWQATSIRTIPGLIFFGSAMAVVVVLARRGRPAPWPTLAWLAVFFLIGVYAARGLAWWPLAAVPVVAGLLVDPAREPAKAEPVTPPRRSAPPSPNRRGRPLTVRLPLTWWSTSSRPTCSTRAS
jgi:DMSO reductase anchor subunit